MQPARIKLHAKEHTNNPVQKPNLSRVMQLVTLRSPETAGRYHPCLLAPRNHKIEGRDLPQTRRTTEPTPSQGGERGGVSTRGSAMTSCSAPGFRRGC